MIMTTTHVEDAEDEEDAAPEAAGVVQSIQQLTFIEGQGRVISPINGAGEDSSYDLFISSSSRLMNSSAAL